MHRHIRTLCAAVVLGVSSLSPALADILVAPTRVVLEDRDRAAELTIVNRGTERQVFRVMIENRRMRDDGSFEPALNAQPGEQFADTLVRFAPRRVTLEPGARQTIRVMARRPGTLPDGEYRSHLRLMSAPEDAGLSAAQASASQGDELSISLVPIRSITIPVIVRKGALAANMAISEARIVPPIVAGGSEALLVRLNRVGTRSAFGHLRVGQGGRDLAVLRGVAVYVPNASRQVRIPLSPEQRAMLTQGTVEISYTAPDSRNPEIYARRSVTLQ